MTDGVTEGPPGGGGLVFSAPEQASAEDCDHAARSGAVEAEAGGAMAPLIGCLLPPAPWECRLVGAFGRAVSLLHPDGALVSLVGSAGSMEARALAHPAGFGRFAAAAERAQDAVEREPPAAAGKRGGDAPGGASVARGDGGRARGVSVTWDGRRLELRAPLGGEAGRIALDFSDGRAWDPREPRRGPISAEAAAAAIQAIRGALALARAGGRPSEGIHGDGPMAAAFGRLSAAERFPANLVGFGPGTTPAGDDWLAGYLAAADLVAGKPGGAEPELRAAVSAALERTTAAGRALLIGALAGAAPAYLSALAAAARLAESGPGATAGGHAAEPAAGESGPGAIEAAVMGALDHGATSGEDALAGFVAGLEAKIPAPRFRTGAGGSIL